MGSWNQKVWEPVISNYIALNTTLTSVTWKFRYTSVATLCIKTFRWLSYTYGIKSKLFSVTDQVIGDLASASVSNLIIYHFLLSLIIISATIEFLLNCLKVKTHSVPYIIIAFYLFRNKYNNQKKNNSV